MRGYVLNANQSGGGSSETLAGRPPVLGFLVLSPNPFFPGPGDIVACFRSGGQDKFDSATAEWTVVRADMNWDYDGFCFGSIAHRRLGPEPIEVAFSKDRFECGPVLYEHVPHMVVDPTAIPGWNVSILKVGDDRVVEVRHGDMSSMVYCYYNGTLLRPDKGEPGKSRDWSKSGNACSA